MNFSIIYKKFFFSCFLLSSFLPFLLLLLVCSENLLHGDRYNVLALAHHLDDIAESFVMSAFHNGRLNTMKANYVNKAGDVRIIRP
jgi:hypothetical protein